MNRTFAPDTLLRLAIVAAAVLDRALRVDGLVSGDHSFRQAHVVANVQKMLADGLFSTPSAWNRDLFLRFYDFPVFQALVATLVRLTGGDAAVVAESLNVAALLVLLLSIWRICHRLGLGALATTATLALLALAPLGRFWFAAPTIDPFTVALSVVSLAAWCELHAADASARARRTALVVWFVTTFLATLIKSPVHAPVAVAILGSTVLEHGWRALVRPRMLAFLTTLLVAQATFLVVSAQANAGVPGWPDRATELAWYFGSASERFAIEPHTTILARLAKQALSVPVTVLALVAAVAARSWPVVPEARRLVLTWSLAAVASSLVFLHVNVVHGYYQLPCLPPLALLGGIGVDLLVRRLRPRASRLRMLATTATLLGLVVAAAWSSERYLARLCAPSTATWRAAGAFVQAHTAPRDFVLYARAEPDDNPVYLYCAQRDGANVHGSRSPADLVSAWGPDAAAHGGRLVLFVPADVAALAPGEPLAVGVEGRLVVLR